MHTILLEIHSILRYVVLILLVISIVKSAKGLIANSDYSSKNYKLDLFAMIATHTQFLLGIILYFVSPIVKAGLSNMGATMKDDVLRFWTVEHSLMMLFGIVLITVGRKLSKKAATAALKHKRIFIFFGLGLILILISIPWPFSTSVPRPW